jgi:hypothetical protein
VEPKDRRWAGDRQGAARRAGLGKEGSLAGGVAVGCRQPGRWWEEAAAAVEGISGR